METQIHGGLIRWISRGLIDRSDGPRSCNLYSVETGTLLVGAPNRTKAAGAEVLIVAPPPMVAPVRFEEFDDATCVRYLEQLAVTLEEMCLSHEFHFLNAGDYISVSPLDGVHLDEFGHSSLAASVADRIQTIFI